MTENVNHPQHYGGDTPYEAIKVIEAWDLGFHLGNAVKYISRAGKKDPRRTGEDIDKAIWYLQRYLEAEFEKLKAKKIETVKPPVPYIPLTSTYQVCNGCVGTSGNHSCGQKAHDNHKNYEPCNPQCGGWGH